MKIWFEFNNIELSIFIFRCVIMMIISLLLLIVIYIFYIYNDYWCYLLSWKSEAHRCLQLYHPFFKDMAFDFGSIHYRDIYSGPKAFIQYSFARYSVLIFSTHGYVLNLLMMGTPIAIMDILPIWWEMFILVLTRSGKWADSPALHSKC